MELLLLDIGTHAPDMPSMEQLFTDACGQRGFGCTAVRELEAGLALLDCRDFDVVCVAAVGLADEALVKAFDRVGARATALVLVLETPAVLEVLGQERCEAVSDFLFAPLSATFLAVRLALMAQRWRGDALQQALLRALPDMMYRVGRDGIYRGVYGPEDDVLATARADVVGAAVRAVLPLEPARQMLATIVSAIDSGTLGYLEYECPQPDGVHHYEARVARCSTDEAVVLTRDVTNRRRAEGQIRAAAKAKQAFASRVLSIQEAERQHLSRELHDSIGQLVLVHRMDAEWLAQKAEHGAAREAAERLCGELDNTLHLVRTLAMDLRPPAIDDLGIDSALETLCADIGRRSGIRCQFSGDPGLHGLGSDVGVALYRIAQEALSNAVRHAECQVIEVEIGHSDAGVELSITDDGRGIPPAQLMDPTSFGLVGMRERAELLGGCVTIHTSPRDGTCIRATVPIQHERTNALSQRSHRGEDER